MNIGLIFAGGVGTRMKSKGMPKQFLKVHGKSIILHTIEQFENHPQIDAILVACVEEYIPTLWKEIRYCGVEKVKWIIPGGKSPLDSQYLGLTKLKEACGREERHVVLLHDGVRPLINQQTITDCIAAVHQYGNAITMSPAVETIITLGQDNTVQSALHRKDCRLGRAPQCFWLDEICAVHERALAEGIRDIPDLFIDSATMMQHYGQPIHVVEGPVENIKITTPMDFYIFKALIDAKENSQIFGLE